MRADRPASRTSTVPRLCSALTAAASGVVLSVAALAPVHAQTPRPAPGPAIQPGGRERPGRSVSPARGRDRVRPAHHRSARARPLPPRHPAGARGRPASASSRSTARRRRRAPAPPASIPPTRRSARRAPPCGRSPASRCRCRRSPASCPIRRCTTVPIRPAPQPDRRGAALVPSPAPGRSCPPSRRRAGASGVIEEDPFAPTGIRAGAFTFYPALELTGGYDTNPAHAPGGKSSWLAIVAPELKVRSDWERHAAQRRHQGQLPRLLGKIRLQCGRLAHRHARRARSPDPRCARQRPARREQPRPLRSRRAPADRHRRARQPEHPGRAGAPADHHHGRRDGRLHPDLQPLRAHRQGHGRSRRLAGLDLHRRRDRRQRGPQLRPVRRRVPRELRSQARHQAVRRGRRRHARARSAVRPQRRAARLERRLRQGRHHLRAQPQAHRRDRGRLPDAPIQGPEPQRHRRPHVRRLADLPR